jgi:hypothetical protein
MDGGKQRDRSARVTIDPAIVKPSRAIAAAARLSPLLVITGRALADLTEELGSDEAAYRHLARVSTNVGKQAELEHAFGEARPADMAEGLVR